MKPGGISHPNRAGLRRELEDQLKQVVEREMNPERVVRREDS